MGYGLAQKRLRDRVTELEKEVEELTKEVKEGQTKLRNIQGRELFVSGFIYDASIAVFEHDEDEPAYVFHTMEDKWLSEESLVSAIRGMDIVHPYQDVDEREMKVQFRVSTFEREEAKMVQGVLCDDCGNVLPDHTVADHMDKEHPVHVCPHTH